MLSEASLPQVVTMEGTYPEINSALLAPRARLLLAPYFRKISPHKSGPVGTTHRSALSHVNARGSSTWYIVKATEAMCCDRFDGLALVLSIAREVCFFVQVPRPQVHRQLRAATLAGQGPQFITRFKAADLHDELVWTALIRWFGSTMRTAPRHNMPLRVD